MLKGEEDGSADAVVEDLQNGTIEGELGGTAETIGAAVRNSTAETVPEGKEQRKA